MVELRGDSLIVVAASAPAFTAGVRPGMTATAGRSLIPALRLVEHKPAAEAADFEALAAVLYQFTPRVFLDCPHAVLLDITGCERLFGSAEALVAKARSTLERVGYVAATGLSENATAAYTLALGGTQTLAQAPVAALRLEASDVEHLAALGVRKVGELLALPLDGLLARFSGVLVARLRELRGAAMEEFAPFQPPQVLRERLEFEGPTDRRDVLMFSMQRIAVALEERLAALNAGALALEAVLRAHEGLPVTFSMPLGRPTRESRSLATLLLGRLESVDTAEQWFDGVEVSVPAHGPVKAPQRNLFSGNDAVQERSIAALVDELTGRLGPDAVARAELTADARPERSFVYRPFIGEGAAPAAPQAPRPAVVFDAHEVSVKCDAAGRPVHWQHGRRESRLVPVALERVHFGWWQGDDAERDYYTVQDEAGALWWLQRRGERWYIVGAF
ncbi:MAG: DNA polymerase Y family protein [Planctomycetes bacterium]|nr:DNA polymerase Y family protein [Planctomycetota bacterium]